MSRLKVHLAAVIAVLLLPFAVRAWLGRSGGLALRDPATAELRIITPHNQDIRAAFAAAFSDWHRARHGESVAITYLSPGGTNDIVRYLDDLYDAYRDEHGQLLPEAQVQPGLDVVWGGGDYTFERDFKPLLKPLALSPELLAEVFPARDLAGVPLFDPAAGAEGPRWVGVVLSSFGIVYAPELYRRLALPPPERWSDLGRPELAGLLALADPTRSGSAAVVYVIVLQRAMADAEARFLERHPELGVDAATLESSPEYRAALGAGWKHGMRELMRMAANARYFTDSGSRPCADVGDAEAAAGIAIDFFARVYEEQIGSDRLRFHAPRAATAITPDPVGVLYGTVGRQERIASRFVEFLLSPEGQRLWNLQPAYSPYLRRSLRRLPIRQDVYADRTGFADDENPFQVAGGFNLRQRWMRQLGALLPVWGAAWLDAKGELGRAYRAVLAVRDPTRRDALLLELSDLPIEYAELSTLGARRQGDDPRLASARERLELAERFRRHYARVLARARGAG